VPLSALPAQSASSRLEQQALQLSDPTSSGSSSGGVGINNPFAVPMYGVGGMRRLRQAGFAELRPLSNTSMCLDTPNNNFAGGQQLALEVCDGSYTQDYVMPIPGFDWRVRVGGLMECMEVENNGTAAGTKVVVSCFGGKACCSPETGCGGQGVGCSSTRQQPAAACDPSLQARTACCLCQQFACRTTC
jgi:hypothetical protein